LPPDLLAVVHPGVSPGALGGGQASISGGGRTKARGMWLPPGSVIALRVLRPAPTEVRASARMLA
jgi:hypothetical protein